MGFGFTEVEYTYPFSLWKEQGLSYILTGFDFPLPWKNILKKRFDFSVMFSYWELGEDILNPNLRIELVKKIVHHLPYKDKVLLWPLCIPCKDKLVPFEEVFYKGLWMIKPEYLVIFGKKLFGFLFPKMPLQYGEFSINNLKILFLPDINRMLPDNREVKKFVWERLKSLNS